jgi:hypothetical protein
MNPCLVRMVAVGVLAAAGTYTGTVLTEPAPAPAPGTYDCPSAATNTVGVNAQGCTYLTDLANAFGAAKIPANALNAARNPLCPYLRTMPEETVVQAWLSSHPSFTLAQAEQYIQITQKDMCL